MKCPLTGKICLLPKEIQVSQIEQDKVTNTFLCNDCGQKYLSAPNTEVKTAFTELVSSPNGISSSIYEDVKRNQVDNRPCPSCGATMQDIIHAQRVGCAKCYEFHNLDSVVMNAQGAPGGTLEHVGKVPANLSAEEQIKRLERQMQAAVAKEDYETAAKVRDEIKKIKDGLEPC